MSRVFFDTNVPLYLLSADETKASRAAQLLEGGGVVSAQVLNELVAVSRRKNLTAWPVVQELLDMLTQVCDVVPLTLDAHRRAVALSQHHGWHIYDASIVACALEAGCERLYTEDLNHGQVVDGLTVLNPFR